MIDLESDLFDGLVLKHLVERLDEGDETVPMPAGEFVQAEERQRRNIAAVLDKIEQMTGVTEDEKKCAYFTTNNDSRWKKTSDSFRWDAESIFDKNLLSTVHLLLHIIHHFESLQPGRVAIDLPKELKVGVIEVSKRDGITKPTVGTETLIR